MNVETLYDESIKENFYLLVFSIEYLVFEKQLITPESSIEELKLTVEKYEVELKSAYKNQEVI